MAYTDVHRAFLQACSNHGLITSRQAHEILISIYARYADSETIPTEDDVAKVVASINKKIYQFDQKIVYTHYSPTETNYYVFVSLQESPIDLMQNFYTPSELHYFRLLQCALVLCGDHCLLPIVCLNLTNEMVGDRLKPLSMSRVEALLAEWEDMGYVKTIANKYYMGPKMLVEFDKFFNANYADQVTRCCLCNETIFYGLRCANCPQILHKECMKKYLRRMTDCPTCKKVWSVPM